MLEIGTKAPEFTLPDQNGKMHSIILSTCNYNTKLMFLAFYCKLYYFNFYQKGLKKDTSL